MKTWTQKAEELLRGAAGPGASREDELVQMAEGIDGNPIGLALVTIRGGRPGPKVWVQAQTHGDEANPSVAILRVLASIKPEELSGTLVMAPAMHATAFRHYMRESPLDGKNGNRIWDKDVSKLGHTKVFSMIWMRQTLELIKNFRPDLMIDMHDGGIPLRIMSHVLYTAASEPYAPSVVDLANTSAMKVIWRHEGDLFGGSVTGEMHNLRVPSLMIESGGTGQIVEEDVAEMARGLANVLKGISMLPGVPENRTDEQWVMSKGNWIRPTRAGFFFPEGKLGGPIAKGEPIGRIVNVFGRTLEELVSPIDGILFGIRTLAVANVGDYIANIGIRSR